MNKKHVCGLLLSVACLLSPLAGPRANAQMAPSMINYQGQLYDPSANGGAGGPLTGLQQVEFRIWDNGSGGTLIWGRVFPVNCNAQGIFNLLLSDGGTLLPGVQTNDIVAAFANATRFLELTVQGHGTAIAPRQQMVSAPYALQSENANNAAEAPGGFDVVGGLDVMTGGANITGNTTITGPLSVSGVSTLTGGVTVPSPATLGGYGTIPIGGIIMWSGATVPDGWALCDGQNHSGTTPPDLRDRFIVGSGNSYANGSTGGVSQVTLTTLQIPAHQHTYATLTSYQKDLCGCSGQHHHDVNTATGNSDPTGGGQSHENRPLFYALAFIMRVK